MDQIVNHQIWRTHALMVARILVGALFIVSGIMKLNGGIDGTAMAIEGAGLPAAVGLAWIAAIIEVVAGVAIVLGYYFREAALALGAYVLIVSFVFHGPNVWGTDPVQQGMFLKNMALIGGLLFMAAHGAGNTWSLKLK